MERALDLDALRDAMGVSGRLPAPEEVQSKLADAEIALLLGRGTPDDALLATGWYLHAVGTATAAAEVYSVARQRQANRVAAHIFDLALRTSDWATRDRLVLLFAAQVSYLRSDLDPNAVALYRQWSPLANRGRSPAAESPAMSRDPGAVSLAVGSALLALDRRGLFPRLDVLRRVTTELLPATDATDLIDTPYGACARVIEACRELLIHLTYNQPDRLDRAHQLLREAVEAPYSSGDVDSRWVAAHLRDIADDLRTSSLWAVIPPGDPPDAAKAMTLGDPSVLTLWPPQLELLSDSPTPLSADVSRLVMSFPTSAGKTLIAQFILMSHVARGAGDACVVVPTHSLARELRRDLDRRLSTMARSAADAGGLGTPIPGQSAIVVMTPEKFAAHLRSEPEALLNRFTFFAFDEAHLVADADRGWTLESAISVLQQLTLNSPAHRLLLISAAIGNRVHFASWIAPQGAAARVYHNDWRGPRRALAVFSTRADWDQTVEQPPRRRNAMARRVTPLYGEVHVRTGTGQFKSLRTTNALGQLTQVLRDGEWERLGGESTPAYRMRASLAMFLGYHGPVLVVEPTKADAQRTAIAMAEGLTEDTATAPLTAVATTRLGAHHPLVTCLKRGVGFHHSALPSDVQAELEEALRSGTLRHLVATTTLVEGVNFPVRSVVIGERGYRSSEGYVTTLDSARLLNAIGRAGRACRETEGWVVLSLQGGFSRSSFEPLEATDSDLEATSTLSTEVAVARLMEFEEALHSVADAVLEFAGKEVADFVSHVWFVAQALGSLQLAPNELARYSIESTLAWQQLDESTRERWLRVAEAAVASYWATSEDRRRRWTGAGTSLPTARMLDDIATAIAPRISELEDPSSPVEALHLILGQDRLERLLSAPEVRFRGFKARRNAPNTQRLEVGLSGLLREWVTGADLQVLGATYLSSVPDETYRDEQLSECISQLFEHVLPWTLNSIIAWANERRSEADDELCPQLPAFVRFGVSTTDALALMVAGLRSRRLANVIAALRPEGEEVFGWLRAMDLQQWRALFTATPSELSDLLIATRAADAVVTSRVLAGEAVPIDLVDFRSSASSGGLELRELDEDSPPRLGAWQADQLVGTVPSRLHDDVLRLLRTGVPLELAFEPEPTPRVMVKTTNPVTEVGWFSSR